MPRETRGIDFPEAGVPGSPDPPSLQSLLFDLKTLFQQLIFSNHCLDLNQKEEQRKGGREERKWRWRREGKRAFAFSFPSLRKWLFS